MVTLCFLISLVSVPGVSSFDFQDRQETTAVLGITSVQYISCIRLHYSMEGLTNAFNFSVVTHHRDVRTVLHTISPTSKLKFFKKEYVEMTHTCTSIPVCTVMFAGIPGM